MIRWKVSKLNTLRNITITCGLVVALSGTSFAAGPGEQQNSSGFSSSSQAALAAGTASGTDTSLATASWKQPRLIPDATSINFAGKKGEPIFRVQTNKPKVALTFDAGSGRGNSEAIMDILEKYNIRGTFFITGNWYTSYPDAAAAIAARGHELGNHSVSHPSFKGLSAEKMQSQVMQTHQLVKDGLGIDMCLFRYPYGDYNNTSMQVLTNCGYYCIQWTVDSLDWKNLGRQPIIDRVLGTNKLVNGSVVLMHMAAEYTPSALEEIVVTLQNRGFEIVPVSELIYSNNYSMNALGIQIPNANNTQQ